MRRSAESVASPELQKIARTPCIGPFSDTIESMLVVCGDQICSEGLSGQEPLVVFRAVLRKVVLDQRVKSGTLVVVSGAFAWILHERHHTSWPIGFLEVAIQERHFLLIEDDLKVHVG